MSGNAHQRNVAETAVAKVLKKMGVQASTTDEEEPTSLGFKLERSSIEAYIFFIVAGGYVVMSAFGVPVNFWAGLGMSLFMAAASIHLLWGSIWTDNWNRLAKVSGTTIIAFVILLVVNQGWVNTHKVENPNADTLSAIHNLSSLVQGISPEIHQNTQILEVDGKYPDIEIGDPREVSVRGEATLINADVKNIGNATARSKRNTAGLFIAPVGLNDEDAIFHYLYKREADRESGIPSEDLAPGGGGIIPVSGPAMREDGTDPDDKDRQDLFDKTKVLYIAILIGYQDSRGHIYHKELCYYVANDRSLSRACIAHNGHG